MPVGNDVVDLRDPANQSDALHPRFDRRVFADVELRELAGRSPEERHLERWMRWAAKEGAFKLMRQLDPAEPFRPRELVVSFASRASARVRVPALGRSLRVDYDMDEERVHAIVTDPGTHAETGERPGMALTGTRRRRSSSPAGATIEVRRLASRSLAEWLGRPADDVEIDDAGADDRRPLARAGDSPLPVDVSLSHDGRWLAWAVVGR